MPAHTLLGATGGTGTAILRSLLDSPPADLTLKIFIRSKSKLLATFPDLESTTTLKLSIIEAPITDFAALKSALSGADVVYNCIATNNAAPGIRIAQDAAEAVIGALERLKQDPGEKWKKPTVLVLRSNSLNAEASAQGSRVGHFIVNFCLDPVYADIEKACNLYASKPDLMDHIFVDPPALHDPIGAERTGHELCANTDIDSSTNLSTSLNYSDLGAGFVEIAQRRDEYLEKAVIVSATGPVRENWPVLIGYMGQGLKARFWG